MSNQVVVSMFKKITCLTLSALSLCVTQVAAAETIEDKIKENLSDRINLPIAAVNKTPFDNLYEVRVQGSIVYTDADSEFVIFSGQLYDLANKANLTELSMEEMNRIDIDSLPLDYSILEEIETESVKNHDSSTAFLLNHFLKNKKK